MYGLQAEDILDNYDNETEDRPHSRLGHRFASDESGGQSLSDNEGELGSPVPDPMNL